MTPSKNRPLAVIRVKTIDTISKLIFRVKGIVLNMGNNTTIYPTPVPALTAVTTDVTTLVTAQALTKTKAPGSIAARETAALKVKTDLDNLLIYVQARADAAGAAADAITVIQTAGFNVKVNGKHAKAPLEATSGVQEVKLVAKAVDFATAYNWDKSADKGVTWVNITTTSQAHYTVKGLNSGDILQFRVRAILSAGPTAWSTAVSAVVQ